jgi:hypothetical protein
MHPNVIVRPREVEKEERMQVRKKDKTKRWVGILLALTLMTVVLMSGTIAKYITEGTGTDDARVAKWGVVITPDTNGLFASQYTTDDTTYAGSLSVVSSSADKVIAPGTRGTGLGFTITGTPEVASRVTFSTIPGNTVYDPLWGGYHPLLWTLTGPSGAIVSDVSLAQLNNAINNLTVDFAPGTDLSTALGSYTVSWHWPFSTSDANDILDTQLAEYGYPTISFGMKVTVTQID